MSRSRQCLHSDQYCLHIKSAAPRLTRTPDNRMRMRSQSSRIDQRINTPSVDRRAIDPKERIRTTEENQRERYHVSCREHLYQYPVIVMPARSDEYTTSAGAKTSLCCYNVLSRALAEVSCVPDERNVREARFL